MPLQATSGAASYDAFGGGVPVVPNYIESVFQTWLYTGNGTSQTITNNIDLSGKGGLTWIKARNATWDHILNDTVRGAGYGLFSDLTSGQYYDNSTLTSFNTDGFTVGNSNATNENNKTFVSWTFREQPKFFDVVTYTGDAVAGRTVAHNLGSVPGCIIVKKTSASGNNWVVYHRSLGATKFIYLNTTAAQGGPFNGFWNDTEPTSTVFSLGINNAVNEESATYVAYLFAHDAGGFGLTGTDNVISCGSFTTDGSGAVPAQNLGYEPQWILYKRTDAASDWIIGDNMRGIKPNSAGSANNVANILYPNLSSAENTSGQTFFTLSPTGFYSNANFGASRTFIYIAIRRGPMKVPTSGTSVFLPQTRTGTGSGTVVVSNIGFTPDLAIIQDRSSNQGVFEDRLRGNFALFSPQTNTESDAGVEGASGQQGWAFNASTGYGNNSVDYVNYFLQRAPGYFDEVCYTGTGSGQVINHNLGVTPELMIFKARNNYASSGYEYWYTNAPNTTYALALNLDVGESYTKISSANSTTVSLGSSNNYVLTNQTYVAYLFATCAGVSKVGSYTGNGSTQTINCGFTGGARLVLIKRTNSTGDWYIYDTARGMTVLTDPYLRLNQTVAETATLGSVTTVSTGFALNSTILAAINISGGTYIFLAIA